MMSRIYNEYARVYHEMYQKIFDYSESFQIHHEILKRFNCKKIAELGCGTGELSRFFKDVGYEYTGIDLSPEMISIAKNNNPMVDFRVGDMRKQHFKDELDAILIAGRSFTHMTSNADVNSCLAAINGSLRDGGLLIFDNFDAASIFADFKSELTFSTEKDGKEYVRVSRNSMNLETGWTWDWDFNLTVKAKDNKPVSFEDHSILRAFMSDEISLFLQMNGFCVIEHNKVDFWFRTQARKQCKGK